LRNNLIRWTWKPQSADANWIKIMLNQFRQDQDKIVFRKSFQYVAVSELDWNKYLALCQIGGFDGYSDPVVKIFISHNFQANSDFKDWVKKEFAGEDSLQIALKNPSRTWMLWNVSTDDDFMYWVERKFQKQGEDPVETALKDPSHTWMLWNEKYKIQPFIKILRENLNPDEWLDVGKDKVKLDSDCEVIVDKGSNDRKSLEPRKLDDDWKSGHDAKDLWIRLQKALERKFEELKEQYPIEWHYFKIHKQYPPTLKKFEEYVKEKIEEERLRLERLRVKREKRAKEAKEEREAHKRKLELLFQNHLARGMIDQARGMIDSLQKHLKEIQQKGEASPTQTDYLKEIIQDWEQKLQSTSRH